MAGDAGRSLVEVERCVRRADYSRLGRHDVVGGPFQRRHLVEGAVISGCDHGIEQRGIERAGAEYPSRQGTVAGVDESRGTPHEAASAPVETAQLAVAIESAPQPLEFDRSALWPDRPGPAHRPRRGRGRRCPSPASGAQLPPELVTGAVVGVVVVAGATVVVVVDDVEVLDEPAPPVPELLVVVVDVEVDVDVDVEAGRELVVVADERFELAVLGVDVTAIAPTIARVAETLAAPATTRARSAGWRRRARSGPQRFGANWLGSFRSGRSTEPFLWVLHGDCPARG